MTINYLKEKSKAYLSITQYLMDNANYTYQKKPDLSLKAQRRKNLSPMVYVNIYFH